MGRRSRASRQLALLAVLGAAGWLRATNGRAQSTQEILPPVGVEIVQVDAVVTDKQGRPIPGLTKADFEVREDGKLQELSVFTVESHLAEPGGSEPAGPPPAPL